MKKPIIIANWKMYVEKPEAAKNFASALKRHSQLLSKIDLTIMPPYVLVPGFSAALGKSKNVRLGAQSISSYTEPMHTGEISAAMLKPFGVSTVLVGHSERRAAGESEEHICSQIKQAAVAGLTTILCIGEKERDPSGSHFTVIEQQLTSALQQKANGKLRIAYEPVWAIGKTAQDAMNPQELEEMAIFIRKVLTEVLGREAAKTPVLYGGSVEESNVAELLQGGGVAGFLVGHASVHADSLLKIIRACLQ